jgi:hypothetical protein
MLVHSFRRKDEDDWFTDYRDFLALFNVRAAPNKLHYLCKTQGVDLYCGWVRGDARFLEK